MNCRRGSICRSQYVVHKNFCFSIDWENLRSRFQLKCWFKPSCICVLYINKQTKHLFVWISGACHGKWHQCNKVPGVLRPYPERAENSFWRGYTSGVRNKNRRRNQSVDESRLKSCSNRSNELLRDKTNKMTCAPSENSDQPGHPTSLIRVFAVRMKTHWVLGYPLNAQRRLIRLGGCPGWSESSLGAHVILLVLSCYGSNKYKSFGMRWTNYLEGLVYLLNVLCIQCNNFGLYSDSVLIPLSLVTLLLQM